MAQEAIIGVDIGTTSTKAVAFDQHGKTILQYAVAYPILSPQPDHAEQDPELVFQAVIASIKTVAGLLCEGDILLKGVSFSCAMHSLMCMDESGRPLTNCIIWADARSVKQAQELKESSIGHEIYLHTGTPLHSMSPLPKICWLKENLPELYKQTHKFIGIKEYVLYRLFGVYKIDFSMASATGLLNIFTLKWHSDALSFAGISTNQLPELVPPSHVLHGMEPALAKQLQIPPNLPFVLGGSDGCLANLGTDAIYPGDAVVTIGTSGAIRVTANRPVTDKEERIFSYILTPSKYILGGAVNNGGIVLQWFRDNFYPPEQNVALDNTEDVLQQMNAEAATISPGADGLIFLPYLLGERAPVWDSAARACFFGIHFTHTRAHFLRALMEGVIFGIYDVGEALKETMGPVKRLFANGGFSKSPLWVQMLADVFNVEVHLTDTSEGSALGAAILGMESLGMINNLEVAGKLIKTERTFYPNKEAHEKYMQNYQVYAELYPRLQQSFKQLQNTRYLE